MARLIEGNPWTEKEKTLLRDIYPTGTKKEVMTVFPDRTWKAISGAANRYKIRKDNAKEPWSKIDLKTLKNNYTVMSTEELLLLFPDRNLQAIQSKASKLNLRKYNKYKDDRTIWSFKYAKEYVESQGYRFVDTYIKNHHRLLKVVCENSHETEIPSYNFENGQRCAVCSGKYKRPFEEVVDYFKSFDYKVISSTHEYENTGTSLEIVCPNGHITTSTYSTFKSGARCQKCYFEIMGSKFLLDFDTVKKTFQDRGCELISNEYEGVHCELDFICQNHKDNGIQHKTFYAFKYSIGCAYCSKEIKFKNSIVDFSKVMTAFTDKRLELLSGADEYCGAHEPLAYICPNHKDKGVQYKSYNDAKFQDDGCNYCSRERSSGENHYNWRGGISKISEHLRAKILPWKQDSFKRGKYVCDITGVTRDLVIHHSHSFSKIVFETIDSLNLDIRTVNGYSSEELSLIEGKCLELHYKYGLGICLNTDIHDLFHILYSNFDFSVEDYYEFKERYNSGEFKGVS